MESNEPALNRMPVSPEPAALRCPRCGRPMQPGQVFAGAAGLSGAAVCEGCGALLDLEPVGAAAEAAAPAVYEEKAVSCAPMDVDRIARAEAVDGWALHDTTVDDRAPDRIVAHFRRPLRVRAMPAPAAEAAAPAPSRPIGRAARAPETARSAPRTAPATPAPAPEAPAPQAAQPTQELRLLFAVVWIIGVIALTRLMGAPGFFIGMFVLPGILRGFLGVPKERRERRR